MHCRRSAGRKHRAIGCQSVDRATPGLASLPMPKVRCGTIRCQCRVQMPGWSIRNCDVPAFFCQRKERERESDLFFLANCGLFFLTNCNLIYLLTVIFIMLVTIGVISVKRFENQLCGPFFMVRYYGPSHGRSFYSHGPEAQSRYNFAFLFFPARRLHHHFQWENLSTD